MEAIMKKITAILIAIFMLANMMAVVASANALPTDITNQIQWVTAFEMYEKKLPIVRADAVFMNAMDYTAATAPGSGIRMCTITDWAERGLEEYFDDYFHDGDGFFFRSNSVGGCCVYPLCQNISLMHHRLIQF